MSRTMITIVPISHLYLPLRRGAMQRPGGQPSIRGLDLRDLRPLERQVSDQALFAEHKAEDWLSHRGRVVLPTSTLRHNGDGRIAAGRPSGALGEVIERILSHEQDDFPVLCHPERQADRGGRDAVIVDRLTLDA